MGFCQSFAIGACLRWPVFAHLLDEDETSAHEGVPACLGAAAAEGAASGLELLHGRPCTVQAAVPSVAPPTAAAEEHEEHEEAGGQRASIPSAVNSEPRAEVLAWLGKEMLQSLDSSAAEALSICVEVILLDEDTPTEEALFQAASVLADEGVPQDLCESLRIRWHSACEAALLVASQSRDAF